LHSAPPVQWLFGSVFGLTSEHFPSWPPVVWLPMQELQSPHVGSSQQTLFL
jgi:hypothetical protein